MAWARGYEEALALYRERRFEVAADRLEMLELQRPGDRSVIRLRTICREFAVAPPPEDWDGVLRMATK